MQLKQVKLLPKLSLHSFLRLAHSHLLLSDSVLETPHGLLQVRLDASLYREHRFCLCFKPVSALALLLDLNLDKQLVRQPCTNDVRSSFSLECLQIHSPPFLSAVQLQVLSLTRFSPQQLQMIAA
jgi:hypothetical protein